MSHSRHVETPGWLTLDTDERVWLRVHPSKNVLLVTFVFGTLLLFAVGALALAFDIAVSTARLLSAVVIAVIFLLTAAVYLLTRRLEYALSSHRAYRAVGLVSKDVDSVDLTDVTDVGVVQSGWQRRLDVGEVRLETESGTPFRFRYVEHPEWVQEQVAERIENA